MTLDHLCGSTPSAPTLHSYIRVSVSEAARDGQSLKNQQQKLLDHAKAHYPDRQFVLWADPGVSGGLPVNRRPQGRQMIAAVQPGDVVIITKLDRLFRNARDALAQVEQFATQKTALVSLDIGPGSLTDITDANSLLQFHAASFFAEFERGLIRQRVKDSIAERRRAGRPFSGKHPPFGFRVEGKGRDARLVENPEEEAIRRLVGELFAAGNHMNAISAELTRRGHRNRDSGPIRGNAVRNYLERSGLISGPIPRSVRAEHRRRTIAAKKAAGFLPSPAQTAARDNAAAKQKAEQAERDAVLDRTLRRLRKNGITGGPAAFTDALNALAITTSRGLPWKECNLGVRMRRLGFDGNAQRKRNHAAIEALLLRFHKDGVSGGPTAYAAALNRLGIPYPSRRRSRRGERSTLWKPYQLGQPLRRLGLTVTNAEREAAIDTAVRRLQNDGITELSALCDAVNAQGLRTFRGTHWTPVRLSRRMRRLSLTQPRSPPTRRAAPALPRGSPQPESAPMAVFGYILTPPETHEIGDEMSLDEQRERIAAHALEQGWELTEIFVDDVVSSSRPFAQRPAGGQLYARLRRGDIIIAARLDRCLRSAAAALELIGELRTRGVSLWLLDLGGDISGDGLAHLALTMFGAVAEVERGGIRERILDAKERQRRAGRFLGGLRPPFGWRLNRDGKTITEDPAEQAALATMRQIRAEGASFPAIARKVREAHGIEMPARVIWRLLNRRPAKQSE